MLVFPSILTLPSLEEESLFFLLVIIDLTGIGFMKLYSGSMDLCSERAARDSSDGERQGTALVNGPLWAWMGEG